MTGHGVAPRAPLFGDVRLSGFQSVTAGKRMTLAFEVGEMGEQCLAIDLVNER